jgi:hypothetical protein
VKRANRDVSSKGTSQRPHRCSQRGSACIATSFHDRCARAPSNLIVRRGTKDHVLLLSQKAAHCSRRGSLRSAAQVCVKRGDFRVAMPGLARIQREQKDVLASVSELLLGSGLLTIRSEPDMYIRD